VARFVDAEEGEQAGLLDLAVDDAVTRGDVGEASVAETGGVDLVGYNLSTAPVAVVIATCSSAL
jgi:hypothetical protein